MVDFEESVLIGLLAKVFANQPIRTRISKLNIFYAKVAYLFTASIYTYVYILYIFTMYLYFFLYSLICLFSYSQLFNCKKNEFLILFTEIKKQSLGNFFAVKSEIKNIVFLINLKAKRCFFKVLRRFEKIFRSKKSKNQLLGLKSQIGRSIFVRYMGKNMRFPKKKEKKRRSKKNLEEIRQNTVTLDIFRKNIA